MPPTTRSKRKDFTQTALDVVQRATGGVVDAMEVKGPRKAAPKKAAPSKQPRRTGAVKR